MLSSLKWPLLIIAGFYLLVVLMMYVFQRNLMYFPRTADRYQMEHNYELARGNVLLKGWVVNPGQDAALLYYGGNAERIDFNLEWMSRLFPDHTLYLVNYRGYGGSGGKPNEEDLSTDAIAVYDDIAPHHEQISLIGRSLGSAVATHVAANRRVHRLALITPFDSILNVARSHYALFPISLLLKDRWEAWKNVEHITASTLILYGDRDNIIPATSTENLIRHFTPAHLEVRKQARANHDDILAYDDAVEALVSFIARDIGPAR